jgi:hypothetical protein
MVGVAVIVAVTAAEVDGWVSADVKVDESGKCTKEGSSFGLPYGSFEEVDVGIAVLLD